MRASATYLVIRGVSAFAGATAFTLNLVYQATVAGLSPLQLILVGTLLETVCFLAQVPTGVLADLRSRRLSVIIGYLLFGAGIMIEGLVPAFAAILVANVVWGIGATFVDGAQEAWIVDEVGPSKAGPVLVRGSQAAQAGGIAGIGASVALAGFGLNVPIVVAASVWLALGLFLVAAMREHNFTPSARSVSMRSQAVAALRVTRRDRALMLILGSLAFTAFASEGLDRLTQVHLLELGIPSVGWFGALSVAGMLGAIGVSEVVRRRANLARPAGLLAFLRAGCALATIVFALAGSFWLAALASVGIALFRAATGPLMDSWLAVRTESATRATVYSLVSQVDAAGQVAGGPPLGLLAERLSIRAALLGAAAIMLPAVLLLERSRHVEVVEVGQPGAEQH
ncbi:MFS transporter [Nonomuraea sp. NPDC050556]|uniref:MFS transporter n=1 Tax=Nonomuraea sp. NPDC050556 TaxID=3364369 RepID=UPI003798CDED